LAVSIRGEVALPTNPNCILYAVEARDALRDGWLALQRVVWSALEQFYSSCGIDCVGYVGRRAWLDRKNQPLNQVLVMFVIDGPASSEDLDRIEAVFVRSPLLWSRGSMESMQPDSFPTLCVKSGKMYQLWSMIEDDPRYLRLNWEGGRVLVVGDVAADVGPSDFLPYMKHVIAGRREIRDADWSMERMRIAFAHHFSEQIVNADGVVHPDERLFMARVFPPDVMVSMQMNTAEERSKVLAEALEKLPHLLGHHDKLAMVGLFFSVCHSDGTLDACEMRVLKDAATVLELDGNEVVRYLTKLW